LGRIAAEKSLPFILDKQEDHSEEVRYALVKALARFSHETALECLKDLANNDMSSQVKRAARAALDKK
jgi:HEAT repeat protein